MPYSTLGSIKNNISNAYILIGLGYLEDGLERSTPFYFGFLYVYIVRGRGDSDNMAMVVVSRKGGDSVVSHRHSPGWLDMRRNLSFFLTITVVHTCGATGMWY